MQLAQSRQVALGHGEQCSRSRSGWCARGGRGMLEPVRIPPPIACALALASSVAGCEVFTHSCTEVGCSDGVMLEVRTGQGGLADGSYVFDLEAGAQNHTCSFVVPDDLPERGSLQQIECTPRLDVFLGPASVCTEQRRGDAVSESCMLVPGQFVLQANVQGTPPELELRLSRDGTLLAEQTLTAVYETTRPNGPDCEPECRIATVEVTLP